MRLIVPYLYHKGSSGVADLNERPDQPSVEPANHGFGRPLSELAPKDQHSLLSERVANPDPKPASK